MAVPTGERWHRRLTAAALPDTRADVVGLPMSSTRPAPGEHRQPAAASRLPADDLERAVIGALLDAYDPDLFEQAFAGAHEAGHEQASC